MTIPAVTQRLTHTKTNASSMQKQRLGHLNGTLTNELQHTNPTSFGHKNNVLALLLLSLFTMLSSCKSAFLPTPPPQKEPKDFPYQTNPIKAPTLSGIFEGPQQFLTSHIILGDSTKLDSPITEQLLFSRSSEGLPLGTLTLNVPVKSGSNNTVSLKLPSQFYDIPLIVKKLAYHIDVKPNESNNKPSQTFVELDFTDLIKTPHDDFLRPIEIIVNGANTIGFIGINENNIDDGTFSKTSNKLVYQVFIDEIPEPITLILIPDANNQHPSLLFL